MTVAARARIERGTVSRLREAPDVRPRREQLPAAVRETLIEERLVVPAGELRLLERWLDDRLFGLGELAPLLRDERVTEVMVNGLRGVWVERNGRLEETGIRFADADEIIVIIERLVAPLGRRIDLASPLVAPRLPDGSRVHAVIPPISPVGPVLTIRRFAAQPLGPDDLVRNGTLTREAMDYLIRAVAQRRSILVSGGTSSGKTTTLNALAFAVGENERIVTIEDAAELRLPQSNVVALETRTASIEGTGAIDVRALLRAALRMRPDRIVVGEVRGGEALDMLQAMNTGHRGSLTTAHANSAAHSLMRIETMALMGGIDLPLEAIREQIRRRIEVVVHQERDASGARRIMAIAELAPTLPHSLAKPTAHAAAALALGAPIDDALRAYSGVIADEDLAPFGIVLGAFARSGGKIGRSLGRVGALLRGRIALDDERSALTAQGRASAIVLVALAPLGGMFFAVMTPDYVAVLADHGRWLVDVASVIEIIGGLWLWRILRLSSPHADLASLLDAVVVGLDAGMTFELALASR